MPITWVAVFYLAVEPVSNWCKMRVQTHKNGFLEYALIIFMLLFVVAFVCNFDLSTF